MSDAYTELLERVRVEHGEIDAKILQLRDQRRQINEQIKALSLRKVQVGRVLLASRPRKKKAAVPADGS